MGACMGTHVRARAGERRPPPLLRALCPRDEANRSRGGVFDIVALSALAPSFLRLILTQFLHNLSFPARPRLFSVGLNTECPSSVAAARGEARQDNFGERCSAKAKFIRFLPLKCRELIKPMRLDPKAACHQLRGIKLELRGCAAEDNSSRTVHQAGRFCLCGRLASSGCAERVSQKTAGAGGLCPPAHTTNPDGFPYRVCGRAGSDR